MNIHCNEDIFSPVCWICVTSDKNILSKPINAKLHFSLALMWNNASLEINETLSLLKMTTPNIFIYSLIKI